MDLREIVEFIKKISVHVGDNIIKKAYINGSAEVSYKSRTNIVTNVDTIAEAYLYNAVYQEFPMFKIISEEGSVNSVDSDYVWHIDPLDGTNNFAHNIPHFCTSVGLYSLREGLTVAGVIYDPMRGEMFSSFSGDGARLNGKKISVSAIDDIGIALIATGFPYDKNNPLINNRKQFNAVLDKAQCVRRIGSAALDLCWIACGRLDGYWEPMLHSWDVSAGSVIVREAGGMVSDYKGNPLNPECPEIIAGNEKIYKQLLKLIQENTDYYPGDTFRNMNTD